MLRFRRMRTLQQFASVHASLHNPFNQERHLVSRETYKARRSAALPEWQALATRRPSPLQTAPTGRPVPVAQAPSRAVIGDIPRRGGAWQFLRAELVVAILEVKPETFRCSFP